MLISSMFWLSLILSYTPRFRSPNWAHPCCFHVNSFFTFVTADKISIAVNKAVSMYIGYISAAAIYPCLLQFASSFPFWNAFHVSNVTTRDKQQLMDDGPRIATRLRTEKNHVDSVARLVKTSTVQITWFYMYARACHRRRLQLFKHCFLLDRLVLLKKAVGA